MTLTLLVLVVLLASLRAVRFFIHDSLSERLIVGPLRKKTGLPNVELTPEQRLELPKGAYVVSAFDCPSCISVWVSLLFGAVAIIVALVFSPLVSLLVFAPLALSYVVLRVFERIEK